MHAPTSFIVLCYFLIFQSPNILDLFSEQSLHGLQRRENAVPILPGLTVYSGRKIPLTKQPEPQHYLTLSFSAFCLSKIHQVLISLRWSCYLSSSSILGLPSSFSVTSFFVFLDVPFPKNWLFPQTYIHSLTHLFFVKVLIAWLECKISWKKTWLEHFAPSRPYHSSWWICIWGRAWCGADAQRIFTQWNWTRC